MLVSSEEFIISATTTTMLDLSPPRPIRGSERDPRNLPTKNLFDKTFHISKTERPFRSVVYGWANIMLVTFELICVCICKFSNLLFDELTFLFAMKISIANITRRINDNS